MKNIIYKTKIVIALIGIFILGAQIEIHAQSNLTIDGPPTTCQGSVVTYLINPNNGLYYEWTLSNANGTTLTNQGNPSMLIGWTQTGATTLTVQGKDAAGIVQEAATLNIAIGAELNPVITDDSNVGCFIPDTPRTDHPSNFEDEGNCTMVCEHSTVVYSVPYQSGVTYNWVINGAISYSQQGNVCTVNWGNPGFGNVRIEETNGTCFGEAEKCIKILEGPTANFKIVDNNSQSIEVCLNQNIIFQDLSSSGGGSPIVSWNWDFGDGTYSSSGTSVAGNGVEHSYAHPGVYNVTLEVINACGCSSIFERKIIVADKEPLEIECPRVVCEGDRVTYFASEKCGGSVWTATGGQILSQNPSEAIVNWDNTAIDGFGYLSLTPGPDCGACPFPTTVKVPVVISQGTIFGPNNVCRNKKYIYRMPQWPTTQLTWSITGNGILHHTDQPNEIVVEVTGPGSSFTLSVDYCNTLIGCTGSAAIDVAISEPAEITGPNKTCVGGTLSYSLNSNFVGNWTLSEANGSFSQTFNNAHTINPTFNSPGLYLLTVEGSQFCPPDPIVIQVLPKPLKPDEIFGPDSACLGTPFAYTAQNEMPNTYFQWSVNNGSTSPAVGTTSHIIFNTAPATISVTRVRTDIPGCVSDALEKVVQSNMPDHIHIIDPVPTSPIVCGSSQWTFHSDYAQGDLYEWKILPPNQAGAASVINGMGTNEIEILFNNPVSQGQLVGVELKVTKCGSERKDTLWYQVNGITTHTATSNVDSICAGETVNFNLSPALGTGETAVWHFGEASSATGSGNSPSHVYSNSDNVSIYYPTVTVTNQCNLSNTIALSPITVLPSPIAHISVINTGSPNLPCNQISANLIATIVPGPYNNTNYAWFGNGPGPNCSNCISWSINQFGDYSLTVENELGCISQTSVTLTPDCGEDCHGEGPEITNAVIGYPDCQQMDATVSYDHSCCTIISEGWVPVVGGQNVSSNTTTSGNITTSTIQADFSVAGIHGFKYEISFVNSLGDTCSIDTLISALLPYAGDLLYDLSCGAGNNYEVTLYDHYNVFPTEENSIYRELAYFDGNWQTIYSGTGTTPPIQATTNLSAGQTYIIREKIKDLNMPQVQECVYEITLTLPAKPHADFTFDWDHGLAPVGPPCERDVPINFTNLSTPNTGLNFLWHFQDNYSNSQTNPSKMFNDYLLSQVTLIATDPVSGCVNTTQQTIDIQHNEYWVDPDKANIEVDPPLPLCEGSPIMLKYHAPTNPSNMIAPPDFTWRLNNVPIPNSNSDTYYAFEDGGYRVIGSDPHGCLVPSNFVPVSFIHPPHPIISGSHDYCIGETVVLNGDLGNTITYEWTQIQPAPTTIVGTTPTLELSSLSVGTYTFVLKITENGCSATSLPFEVTIHGLPNQPDPDFDITNCQPYKVKLSILNPFPGTYNWSNGAVGSTITVPAGGSYRVTYTDPFGCTAQNELIVPKSPEEYLWVFPTGCFCLTDIRKAACEKIPANILGPLPNFVNWAYLLDGVTELSGTGPVPNHYFNFVNYSSGKFQLQLDNGYCEVESGIMNWRGEYCHKLGLNVQQPKMGDASFPYLKLIPNPAKNKTTLAFYLPESLEGGQILVYDEIGRQIISIPLQESSGTLELDLHQFAAGTYRVILLQEGKQQAQTKLSLIH